MALQRRIGEVDGGCDALLCMLKHLSMALQKRSQSSMEPDSARLKSLAAEEVAEVDGARWRLILLVSKSMALQKRATELDGGRWSSMVLVDLVPS